jgi:hypothetical protein
VPAEVLPERTRDELAETDVGACTLDPDAREQLLGNSRIQVDERIVDRSSLRDAPWHDSTS